MAITQARMMQALAIANAAAAKLAEKQADIATLSGQLASAYAQGLAIDLPYIMSQLDRIAAAAPLPLPDITFLARETYHYEKEAKANTQRAAAAARRRYLLGHEDIGTRQSAIRRGQDKPRAYPSLEENLAAIAQRAGQSADQSAGRTASAGRSPFPLPAQSLPDQTPPTAEELAAFAAWNAGGPAAPVVLPQFTPHDSRGWAAAIVHDPTVVVELPDDLYSTDPLADPAVDPFDMPGGQE